MKSINNTNVGWRAGALAGLALLLPATGLAQEVASAPAPRAADAAAVQAFWTVERMRSAQPMPVPTVPMAASKSKRAAPPNALPGWSPGWSPESGLKQPRTDAKHWMPEEEYVAAEAAKFDPQHGPAPTNPRDGPYPPFQRWTWNGKYIQYPMSTVGKLFFTLPGIGNFVCSASVIGRSTLATAGHCVSSGTGIWATNMLFCPSYRAVGGGGPHPKGCWAGITQTTSAAWHFNSDFDRDYACIVTANTGTVTNNKIGNNTGWTGRAWNWYGVMELALGYPAAAPFPGYNIIAAASTDWYTQDWGNDTNQYAKFIGNDSTGGSSGGPWWLGMRHEALEYADTDGNNNTDPGQPFGPYINGVNSHKRCTGGTCQSPPTTTAGVFWQEMGSSAFRSTAGDGGESEDVFAVCLAHANNNP